MNLYTHPKPLSIELLAALMQTKTPIYATLTQKSDLRGVPLMTGTIVSVGSEDCCIKPVDSNPLTSLLMPTITVKHTNLFGTEHSAMQTRLSQRTFDRETALLLPYLCEEFIAYRTFATSPYTWEWELPQQEHHKGHDRLGVFIREHDESIYPRPISVHITTLDGRHTVDSFPHMSQPTLGLQADIINLYSGVTIKGMTPLTPLYFHHISPTSEEIQATTSLSKPQVGDSVVEAKVLFLAKIMQAYADFAGVHVADPNEMVIATPLDLARRVCDQF